MLTLLIVLLGGSLLVLQGVKLNYMLVKAKNEKQFWRKQMALVRNSLVALHGNFC